MQLVVLGMHRSGTSMIARLINLMGAYVGPEQVIMGADQYNPKGYWERWDVMVLNDALLLAQGCTWNRVAGWTVPQPPMPPGEVLSAMRSIVLHMDAFRPWEMKDPRLCLTLPYWKQLLEVPVAVLVYRDPLEIVRSLEIRNNMSSAQGLALWEYHAVGALNASQQMPRVFVCHDTVLANPVESVERLLSDLVKAHGTCSLRMPAAREIRAFVDSNLNQSRVKDPGLRQGLTPAQQEVVAMLRGEVPQKQHLDVSGPSLEVMARMKAEQAKEVQTLAAILRARL
jgi:hypothetical protein